MKKEKISLYLDDVRTPTEQGWEVVRTYEHFINHIQMHGLESYQLISLDHDLGHIDTDEKTGLDCAKFLVTESMTRNIPLPQIYVHSANPIGSANIIGYINNYSKSSGMPENCVHVEISHTA